MNSLENKQLLRRLYDHCAEKHVLLERLERPEGAVKDVAELDVLRNGACRLDEEKRRGPGVFARKLAAGRSPSSPSLQPPLIYKWQK